MLFVCRIFTSPLGVVVDLYKEVFLHFCTDYTAVAGSWARRLVNHTSWVAVVTPTNRLKSVCYRCVIELFGGVFVLSLCIFNISAGV